MSEGELRSLISMCGWEGSLWSEAISMSYCRCRAFPPGQFAILDTDHVLETDSGLHLAGAARTPYIIWLAILAFQLATLFALWYFRRHLGSTATAAGCVN